MWPGPYGDHGSRKYLLASLDQSLGRLGLDYVDIFYHHRFDPDTPLEETMGALDAAVRQGKALYVGISSYSDVRTREAVTILRSLGTPLLIHQPSYSMFNRWIEDKLLDVLGEEGVGCIGFSPLAQGLLTERYLQGIPAGSRASENSSLSRDMLSEENLGRVRALAKIAAGRGQKVSQLALAWALRDPRVTSLVIGASSVAQLEENVVALDNLDFTRRGAEGDRCLRRRRRHRSVAGAGDELTTSGRRAAPRFRLRGVGVRPGFCNGEGRAQHGGVLGGRGLRVPRRRGGAAAPGGVRAGDRGPHGAVVGQGAGEVLPAGLPGLRRGDPAGALVAGHPRRRHDDDPAAGGGRRGGRSRHRDRAGRPRLPARGPAVLPGRGPRRAAPVGHGHQPAESPDHPLRGRRRLAAAGHPLAPPDPLRGQ